MIMVWIPRRHRTLVYKLLVLIPVAWITIAFLLYNGNSTPLAATELAHHEQQQQQPGAQVDNSNEEIVIPPAVAIAQKPTPETADNG